MILHIMIDVKVIPQLAAILDKNAVEVRSTAFSIVTNFVNCFEVFKEKPIGFLFL